MSKHPSASLVPEVIGDAINKLMDHIPQKSIAFDLGISFRDVSDLHKNWPLFCGLGRYNGKDED